jgi:hypothetical protein
VTFRGARPDADAGCCVRDGTAGRDERREDVDLARGRRPRGASLAGTRLS